MKNSKNNTSKKKTPLMSEEEVAEMQRKIDEGIHLAQMRLIERARHNGTTLVVAQDDRIVEIQPSELTRN